MLQNKFSNHLGLTLIELLVVIAIIAFLSTLGLVAINDTRAKARDTVRKADMRLLLNALELHFAINKNYPIQTDELKSTPILGNQWFPAIKPQMPSQPVDPRISNIYYYSYKSNGVGTQFEINVKLEGDIDLMTNDGGNNLDRYEMGNDLTLMN